jgi:regulator of sirC expression with transglutaminase-like and TPR domain
VQEVAARVRPSLVKITQIGRDGAYGVGSGFVLGGGSLVATNKHVIGEARRLVVESSDGRRHPVVEVLAHDTRLDLALLRLGSPGGEEVAEDPKKNQAGRLPSLELADSDEVRQGDPIVAMGNPEGLAFSVVDGVVSEPRRDVDGLSMLQVAVPIERGNSGGPLLDRRGRVLGILTLKSARTENLGFAMPVNALKGLLEKPNPIPMERWLTIGVLNPRLWKTALGAQWTQRAGTVHVSHPGDGFGGRALCLWQDPPGAESFSASVTVWLSDESGAAGLAFCADEEQRHYGFYPTGGRLRLTRFDGPDVFSWKILREVESDAYRPGDWNTLRVELEGDMIRCHVNEKKVFELSDTGLRGGRAGLCKFRGTVASFKGFRTGAVERVEPGVGADIGSLRGALEDLLRDAEGKEGAVANFLKRPEASRELLTERARVLERQAGLLREVEGEVHRAAARLALVRELAKPDRDADLLKCALLLSRHDNPELDPAVYEAGFSQMVAELRGDPELAKGTSAAVRRISRFLFEENGFHGNRYDSDNRANSYINEVLDDREGLPISLSVVFIEMARRLGVEGVVGIPLPGRFMVGYRESEEDPFALVDVYQGGRFLTMEEGVAEVADESEVPERYREPALKRDILLRMVRNLMAPLTRGRGLAREALPYLDLVIAVDPRPFRERLSRAMLRETQGNKTGAQEDVGWLLEHLPEDPTGEKRAMLEQWLDRVRR